MNWTKQQLLVAFSLYCRIPFGKFHQHNPEIIYYAKLLGRTPSALAMKLSNIASLDPVITTSGRRGLAGASQADRQMWGEMQQNWSEFVEESNRVIRELGSEESFDEVDSEEEKYSGRERNAYVKVRIGQDFFRKSVLSAYDGKCCISGLAIKKLLVASHIKPWSVDESNRLNPKNGLALSALYDKAFDWGIITIDKDLRILVSRKYNKTSDGFFNTSFIAIEGQKIALAEKFSPDQIFLEYHRDAIYEKRF